MTSTPHIRLRLAAPLFALAGLFLSLPTTSHAATGAHTASAYQWPVKPFDREHPVRGNFGDPRTVFAGPPSRRTLLTAGGSFQFHFGVDISAPNGTAVYPVASGVVIEVTHEEIVVACPVARRFQYWHLHAAVHPGDHVEAGRTVLGWIAKPSGHVHLSEVDDGVEVNPLQRGHLTPYSDHTAPRVTAVFLRHGELEATAVDFPSLPVPGAWHDLPVTPARIAWRLETTSGVVAIPERVVFDVTQHLPAAPFWSIYARGTHQNMTTFTKFYAYRQPGSYIFQLGAVDVAPGTYRAVVTATDIRGNVGSRTSEVVVP